MKKGFIVFLTMLMCCMTLAYANISVLAAGTNSVFVLESKSARAGSEISLNLKLNSEQAATSFALSAIQFDENALEFVGFVDKNENLGQFLFKTYNDTEKNIVLGGPEAVTCDNVSICNIKFKVKDNATIGEYTIKADAKVLNVDTEIENQTAVPLATITVLPEVSYDEMELSVPTSATYNGQPQTIEVVGKPDGATETITITKGGVLVNEAINVGIYKVKAVVTADGMDPWEQTKTFTINPLGIKIKAENKSMVVNGNIPALTYALAAGSNALVAGDSLESLLTGNLTVATDGKTVGAFNIIQDEQAPLTLNNTNYRLLEFAGGILTVSNADGMGVGFNPSGTIDVNESENYKNNNQKTLMAYVVDGDATSVPTYNGQTLIAVEQKTGSLDFGSIKFNTKKIPADKKVAVVMGGSDGEVFKSLLSTEDIHLKEGQIIENETEDQITVGDTTYTDVKVFKCSYTPGSNAAIRKIRFSLTSNIAAPSDPPVIIEKELPELGGGASFEFKVAITGLPQKYFGDAAVEITAISTVDYEENIKVQ